MRESNLTPEFKSMLDSAKTYFKQTKSNKFEYHQCLILKNRFGEEFVYSFASDSIKELIAQCCSLVNKEKLTHITNIVCMWEGESIDVPSHQFIKELCQIDPENKEAEVLLNSSPTSHIYITKKISDIIE